MSEKEWLRFRGRYIRKCKSVAKDYAFANTRQRKKPSPLLDLLIQELQEAHEKLQDCATLAAQLASFAGREKRRKK